MAGFPTRPKRATFGPTYKDVAKVVNPETEVGASVYNLAFWQLAGISIVSPLALLFVDASGTGATTTDQRIAWDPDAALALIAWTRNATGVYTATFAANYNDADGNAVPTALKAGAAWVTEANDKSAAYAKMLSGTQVEVRTFNAAGAAADLDFAVLLY
jgi:hypothetical protein